MRRHDPGKNLALLGAMSAMIGGGGIDPLLLNVAQDAPKPSTDPLSTEMDEPGYRLHDWDGFRLVQEKARLTNTEKRRLKRDAVMTVSYAFAVNQARSYYNHHSITGTEKRNGRTYTRGKRPKRSQELYLAWCRVATLGGGMVDGLASVSVVSSLG